MNNALQEYHSELFGSPNRLIVDEATSDDNSGEYTPHRVGRRRV
jgi:hypothetical protein